MRVSTTDKAKQEARLYAGPMPPKSELIGLVARSSSDKGALILLTSGQYVQLNAGCIRSLNQRDVQVRLATAYIGSHTSPAKSKSSAENGKKGGRPKKG